MILPSGPLADALPLRDTTAWTRYSTVEILPLVAGRATVAAIPYPLIAKRYVLADHAIEGVDAVYLGGEAIAGWRHTNGTDMAGHAVAYLDLSAAVDGEVTADVRGLSGNPGDLLALLAPSADLRDLTARMRNAGITLGGALRASMTRRAAIQFIVDQFGGCWSAGMPGFASEFPPPDTDPVWETFGPLDRAKTQARCALSDVVTLATVAYDAGANDQPRYVLRLAASSRATHGDRAATLSLPWVKTARVAEQIGTRWLQWRARPLWTLQFSIGPRTPMIPPGAWITLTGSDVPITGSAVVLDSDPDLGGGAATLTVQAPAGATPTVTVSQSAAA